MSTPVPLFNASMHLHRLDVSIAGASTAAVPAEDRGHKALIFTQMTKSLDVSIAGASTTAVPVEDRGPQGAHLHPDDQDARCAGELSQPAWLHLPAPGWDHQARAATGIDCALHGTPLN